MLASPREVEDSPESDRSAVLVRAARRGDVTALDELATQLLPRARNLVRYLVRGDEDVDDIAQEGLIAVLRGLGTYRGHGTLTAWVDRIVARTTFAWLRTRQRRVERALRLAATATLWESDAKGTEDYVARRRMVRQLDTLPLEQRHALVLHHVLGMSIPEVAREIGASVETVRSRLRLGKQKLLARHQSLLEQEVV